MVQIELSKQNIRKIALLLEMEMPQQETAQEVESAMKENTTLAHYLWKRAG